MSQNPALTHTPGEAPIERFGDIQSPMANHAPWIVFVYEVWMWRSLRRPIADLILAPLPLGRAVQNALTESLVLHTRQLCDICTFKVQKGKSDDITPTTLLKTELSQPLQDAIATLKSKYGTQTEVGSPCWVFNKMCAHSTQRRGANFNYEAAFNAVDAILEPIIPMIEQYNPALKGTA